MSVTDKFNDKMDRSFLDADLDELVKKMKQDEKISVLAGRGWWE